jgi:hypothetical protein
MKNRTILVVLVTLLALVMCGGCAPGKYTPQANEETYGTWTNPNYAQQKVVRSADGTWQNFAYTGDTVPSESGTFQLVKKWKDADGNTWYHEDFKVLKGVYTYNAQRLDKIDKSGKVWETMFMEVARFDTDSYPKQLDPKSESYGIFYRAGG